MKKVYLFPKVEEISIESMERMLVTVSGKDGSLSDGTDIGDGGDDDGEVNPAAKGNWDTLDDVWD